MNLKSYGLRVGLPAFVSILLAACAGQTEFSIEDQREAVGSPETQTVRLDNVNSTSILRKDEKLIKNFNHDTDVQLSGRKAIDKTQVREKILEHYKLSDRQKQATCVIPVEVPAGKRMEYEIQWTKVSREGIIREGKNGSTGDQLGTYSVTMGYNCTATDQRVLN